ncbi:hypothetical protein N1031_04395 [Herbiconiux moechotypicola]|uniref:Uncharacterized protein n=1 Tax=Herbiconiux moechotypicola TaxID=637393 RepID=A0ABN3DA21_9MICO|nr:hypothetical protein [Herbiconiux moechotypicola]MCS5728990.1 hypothetical protein [Herbiconiux moechotypicola]
MGFSPIGLIVSLAVLAPNLLLLPFPPRDQPAARRIPPVLTWVERAGQGLCLVVPAITEPGAVVWWWAPVVAAALAGYCALWLRYLLRGRSHALLFEPVWRIPVPMALLPVVAFLATAAWLGNPWIALAAVVLAAGHIPISLLTAGATASR